MRNNGFTLKDANNSSTLVLAMGIWLPNDAPFVGTSGTKLNRSARGNTRKDIGHTKPAVIPDVSRVAFQTMDPY
jgi:hypothetical protein